MNTAARGSRRNNNTLRRQPAPISGPAPLTSQRRRRSSSPDPQPVQDQRPRKPEPSHVHQNERKKSGNPSLPSSGSRSFFVAVDDTNLDRGRKSKAKPRSHNRHLAENTPHASTSCAPEGQAIPIKTERSKSRESAKLPSKSTASDAEGSGRDTRGSTDAHVDYRGPLAAAEFAKMKRELDSWKKLSHENKKAIKRQNKVIEDLKQQENTLKQKLKETESHLSRVQSKQKKSDEAITTVESNSQCQICMELLHRPYALSPCGHILCVTCLQEWFRKAPVADEEMYDDNDPEYLLRRRKTCPCCRAHVRHRPIPVFMIKAIVAAIAKVKGSQTGVSLGRDLASNDSDPWEGLFPDEEEIDDYGATDEEEDDDDEDEDVDEDEDESSWYEEVFSYGSGSEEEPYQGAYMSSQWEPPSVVIDEDDFLFDQLDESDLNCLRRGVTIGMLHEFEVEYKHEEGLIARDRANNRIYLGWNIRLSADDENGELYMQYIADDILARPERWCVIVHDDDQGFDAYILVPEEEVFEYEDTDTDNYMEVDDLD